MGAVTRVIRVVVVDDDPLVRSGLVLILGGSKDLEVVGQAADGAAAVELVRTEGPDVVLMDIRMPVLDGIGATGQIRSGLDEDTGPRVIVLTTFGADEYVVRALAAGAHGFLLKDTPPAEIVGAIRIVARGEPMLSPGALRGLIRQVTTQVPDLSGGERADQARARLDRLTERERDVALAVAHGLSNTEIAGELYLSIPTVKAYVGRLFTKLDVVNRVQVAICVHDAQPGATDDRWA